MSAKKGRGAKRGRGAKKLTVPQHGSQKASSNDNTDSPDMSAIERASFLEGLQHHYGNPLHSTAMEEDLNVLDEQRMNGGKAGRKEKIPQTSKTAVKQRGAAAKRKEAERDGEKKVEKKKERRSTGGTSAARPLENPQLKKGMKRKSGTPSDPESQWPSPKKAKPYSLGRSRKSSSEKSKSRKSSSGSASADPEKVSTDKPRKRRRGGQRGTQLEVVLDAFLDFCEQYRESVESEAVKQCVDSFSSNVKVQLLEKISSSKEFKVLKRENVKVGSLVRTKTRRLLEAKHELMRAERQVWLLQKEKDELKVRLADLRRGQTFLHDIRQLNRQYLDYRHKHPKEKQMYGASSLPALLLETKFV